MRETKLKIHSLQDMVEGKRRYKYGQHGSLAGVLDPKPSQLHVEYMSNKNVSKIVSVILSCSYRTDVCQIWFYLAI